LDAKNNIKDIIGNDSKKQELAASWLMSLLGFRTVHPDRNNERISGTHYSVDILCQYSDDILLAIDCKTSVPKDSDMASHIAKTILCKNVIPLLISSEDCSGMKPNNDVSIMDRKACESICDLILNSRILQAKKIFSKLVFGG
jgi:hypothetical protein